VDDRVGDVAQGVRAVGWLARVSKEYPRARTERTRDLFGREYGLEKKVSLSGDHKSDSFAKSETATAHPRSKLRGPHKDGNMLAEPSLSWILHALSNRNRLQDIQFKINYKFWRFWRVSFSLKL
jgi:hypothetical protein